MDGDSKQKKNRSLPANIPDACNVLFTIWLRHVVQADHGSKWIILDGRRSLLLGFRFFLAMLYFTYEICK